MTRGSWNCIQLQHYYLLSQVTPFLSFHCKNRPCLPSCLAASMAHRRKFILKRFYSDYMFWVFSMHRRPYSDIYLLPIVPMGLSTAPISGELLFSPHPAHLLPASYTVCDTEPSEVRDSWSLPHLILLPHISAGIVKILQFWPYHFLNYTVNKLTGQSNDKQNSFPLIVVSILLMTN